MEEHIFHFFVSINEETKRDLKPGDPADNQAGYVVRLCC